MHACPRCGQPTNGSISEGGLHWAICDDCMDDDQSISTSRPTTGAVDDCPRCGVSVFSTNRKGGKDWQFLEKTCVFEFDTPEPAPSALLPPRVRVVRGERWNWYHRCIGEEFEVIEFNEGGCVVKDHHKIGNSDIGFILSEDCIPVYPEPAAAVTFHAGDAGYSDNPETPQVDGEGNLLY